MNSAFLASDVTCILIPTTKPTTRHDIRIMELDSFLELSCTNLSFMLFDLRRNRNVFGCLVYLSELSWTVLDWDLTTDCLHLDHVWDLSESKSLHADTGLIRATKLPSAVFWLCRQTSESGTERLWNPCSSFWERVNWPFWYLWWQRQLCHVYKNICHHVCTSLGQ